MLTGAATLHSAAQTPCPGPSAAQPRALLWRVTGPIGLAKGPCLPPPGEEHSPAAAPSLCGTRGWCTYEPQAPDNQRWSRGGDAGSGEQGERLQTQTQTRPHSLPRRSAPAVQPDPQRPRAGTGPRPRGGGILLNVVCSRCRTQGRTQDKHSGRAAG